MNFNELIDDILYNQQQTVIAENHIEDFFSVLELQNKWIEGVIKQNKTSPLVENLNKSQYNVYKDSFKELGLPEDFIQAWRNNLFLVSVIYNSSNLMDVVFSDNELSVNPNEMISYKKSKSWPLLMSLEKKSYNAFFSLLKYGATYTDDFKVLSEISCSHSRHPFVNLYQHIGVQEYADLKDHWWTGFVYQPEMISKYSQDEIPQSIIKEMLDKEFKHLSNEYGKEINQEVINELTQKDWFAQIFLEQMLENNMKDRYFHYDMNNNQQLPLYPSREMLLSTLFIENTSNSFNEYKFPTEILNKLKEHNLYPNDKEKESILTLLIRRKKEYDHLIEWDFSVNNGKAIDALFEQMKFYNKSWNTAGELIIKYRDYVSNHYPNDFPVCAKHVTNMIEHYYDSDERRIPKHELSQLELLSRKINIIKAVSVLNKEFPKFPLDKQEVIDTINKWEKEQEAKILPEKKISSPEEIATYEKNVLNLQIALSSWLNDEKGLEKKNKQRL
jgi:hypothetical protein